MSKEELELCENEKVYPPRFVVTVRGLSAAKDSRVVFTFEGATKKIVKEIILTKGIVYVMWMLVQHHE